MEAIYQGKTKDVLVADGKCYLKFKDDVTGTDGVIDTGGNEVAGSVEGSGLVNLKVSTFFFEEIEKRGIPTHYIASDFDQTLMEVKEATHFGHGLEVITRLKAVGSFIRRYGLYIEEGSDLDFYTEITLKDDQRNDPLIIKEGLVQLNIVTAEEYEQLIQLNKEITQIIRDILAENGLVLYDIKLEYGRDKETSEIILIDEVSGGNMRVYKDEEYVEPIDLINHINIGG
ncbi:phosphoribosylaminoimidazolesuccinocarboxamide synthase [Falseniella ignava]|uniref:phosphoribosylaminoimidazolesuccinocarboxamide synthase n=1 Tax=Falseniella ignava CCUG 37419 TaxID=883112 RepID=K1ME80_9LACT|nr:phosphoribosylaminoimidazolesuccinocarboxamide synthase [Falseniella ignava]EKB54329.1 phosphoribosylaminoimidazolesuccinocarboxamide synthase [Falseniella ignava CCUG 37419]